MKVKDPGQSMSNDEVLRWIRTKRSQHAKQPAEDRHTPQLHDYLISLERHERHLSSDAYPYEKNPSVYGAHTADRNIQRFGEELTRRIQEPIMDKYKEMIRAKRLTVSQAQKMMAKEQRKKELTEAELLMINNHAPMEVEMLQPMLEEVDDRFTQEELEAMVEAVKVVFRADEMRVNNG